MGLLPKGGESPSVPEEPLPGVLHISTGQCLSQQQPAGPGPVAKSILYSLHSIQVILGTLLSGGCLPSTPFSSRRQQLRAVVLEVGNEP